MINDGMSCNVNISKLCTIKIVTENGIQFSNKRPISIPCWRQGRGNTYQMHHHPVICTFTNYDICKELTNGGNCHKACCSAVLYNKNNVLKQVKGHPVSSRSCKIKAKCRKTNSTSKGQVSEPVRREHHLGLFTNLQ